MPLFQIKVMLSATKLNVGRRDSMFFGLLNDLYTLRNAWKAWKYKRGGIGTTKITKGLKRWLCSTEWEVREWWLFFYNRCASESAAEEGGGNLSAVSLHL